MSKEGPTYYNADGKRVHQRNVGKVDCYDKYGVRKYSYKSLKKEKRPGKHRYLMPLDEEMRKRVEPLRATYPKRATSIDGDATGDHPEEGGPSPTVALQ